MGRPTLLAGGSAPSVQRYFPVCRTLPRLGWQAALLSLSSSAAVSNTGVAPLMLVGAAPMEPTTGAFTPHSRAVMVRVRGKLTKYLFRTVSESTYFSSTEVGTSAVKRVMGLWGDSIFALLPAGSETNDHWNNRIVPEGSTLFDASRMTCWPVAMVSASCVIPTRFATGNGCCFAHAARASTRTAPSRLRQCRIVWASSKKENLRATSRLRSGEDLQRSAVEAEMRRASAEDQRQAGRRRRAGEARTGRERHGDVTGQDAHQRVGIVVIGDA